MLSHKLYSGVENVPFHRVAAGRPSHELVPSLWEGRPAAIAPHRTAQGNRIIYMICLINRAG